MGIVDSLLSVPAQPSCCKQLLTPQQRGTCWLLVPCNMLVLTPSHPPLSLSSRSEIQFRQVAGDFERFQGKWMLQGIGGSLLYLVDRYGAKGSIYDAWTKFPGADAAEAKNRGPVGAPADGDDNVADGLVDRQVGADRGSHRLLDQVGVGSAGPTGGVGDGASLDLGDRRRHADDDLRPGEAADPDALQQQADHALGDLEVGDGAAAQRADRHEVARRSTDHPPPPPPRCRPPPRPTVWPP